MKITTIYDQSADAVLHLGDSYIFNETIPSNSIDLIVTSPPYNLGKEYEKKLTVKEYIEFQEKMIIQCVELLKDSGSICWQVGNYVDNGEIIPIDYLIYPIFSKLKLKLRNRIIWHYGHGLHSTKRFSGRYEVLLWFTKTDKYKFQLDEVRVPQKYPSKKYFKGPKKGELSGNPLGKNPTDIWNIPNVKANHIEKTIHPCQFPIELIERLVLSMTEQGDWVYDPYMGVGSTPIASMIHGRRAIGSELLPQYYEIAMNRIKLAEEGKLKIRPMDRPVYDPKMDISIPPKIITFNESSQMRLLDKRTVYSSGSKDENNS